MRCRRDYQAASKRKQPQFGRYLLIEISQNLQQKTRLGITVTRRYGKSHERNRFKRVVREAFRITQYDLPLGLDLVVKPRRHLGQAKTGELVLEMTQLVAGSWQNSSIKN